ncbi:MerR family transcriptional regulator [Spirochaeta dissipatitropha]
MQGKTLAEVCDELSVKPHILRYWEEQVPWLAPERSMGGHRAYSESHVHLLFRFKYLVETRGFTLQGAADQLISENTGAAVEIKSKLHPLRYSLLQLQGSLKRNPVSAFHDVVEAGSAAEGKTAAGKADTAKSASIKHPVEDFFPGITSLGIDAQLHLLRDYSAFRSEFRLPLQDFLYPEAAGFLPEPAREVRRKVNIIQPSSKGLFPGSPTRPLVIIAPVYSSVHTVAAVSGLLQLVEDSDSMHLVLLCSPGEDEDYIHEALTFAAGCSRIHVHPLPVFPDISPENRLILSPDQVISRYYPGPGIALSSVLGGMILHNALVWYHPLGLHGLSFRLPSVAMLEWIDQHDEISAVVPVAQGARGRRPILPVVALRIQDGQCPGLLHGFTGCSVVREKIPVINRLDKPDDIIQQEVRRVRASVTDLVKQSAHVSVYYEK